MKEKNGQHSITGIIKSDTIDKRAALTRMQRYVTSLHVDHYNNPRINRLPIENNIRSTLEWWCRESQSNSTGKDRP